MGEDTHGPDHAAGAARTGGRGDERWDAHGRVPRPPFHPQVQALVDGVHLPSITPDLVGALRAQNAGDPASITDEWLRREDHTVPAPDGAQVPVSVWTPTGARDGARPCYVFLHGGGLVSGDRFDAGDVLPLVLRDDAVLVTVDHRLAPEHPAPAPVEDCVTAVVWVVEHHARLGIDPDRVLLAGTSAGGGLALGVLLALRDRGGPRLRGAWLNTPMVDDRGDTVSSHQYHRLGVFWDGVSDRTGWDAALGEPAVRGDVRPYDAPARATWFGDLPPLLVTVGSAEPFRDGAVAVASSVWRDGGRAQLLVLDGGTHCFASALPDASISRTQRDVVEAWFTSVLHPDDPADAADAVARVRREERHYHGSASDRA